MDFDLPEDVIALQEGAREFAERELADRAMAADEEETFVEEQWKAAAEAGWAGMWISERYGGGGVSTVGTSAVLMEIARACASTAVTLSVHGGLCSTALERFGTEEQRRRFLPKLASGEWLGAYALSEAGSGSDAASLRCAATPDGNGGWTLEGHKLWITSGDRADLIVVFARTSAEPRGKGVTAFLVETASPGFHAGKKEKKMGIRGSSTVEIRFEGYRVPPENVLGEPGRGFATALALLDGGRIGIASQALGIAQACLDASLKYAKERTQFGQPIADFQSIVWKLSEMATRIDAARLLTFRAALLKDAGRPHTKEFPVERWFRDARVTEIYEGTTEIQNLVIARELLER